MTHLQSMYLSGMENGSAYQLLGQVSCSAFRPAAMQSLTLGLADSHRYKAAVDSYKSMVNGLHTKLSGYSVYENNYLLKALFEISPLHKSGEFLSEHVPRKLRCMCIHRFPTLPEVCCA